MMRKLSCHSPNDNVSTKTVSSISSSIEESTRHDNFGYVTDLDGAQCTKDPKSISIEGSKEIQVGNNINYLAPVTFQADVLHIYGKHKILKKHTTKSPTKTEANQLCIRFDRLQPFKKVLLCSMLFIFVVSIFSGIYFIVNLYSKEFKNGLYDEDTVSSTDSIIESPTESTGITDHTETTTPVETESFEFVTRNEWNARQPNKNLTTEFKSQAAIQRIILSETQDRQRCESRADCIDRVFTLQRKTFIMNGDISHNFLIGSDNAIYEGRGFRTQSSDFMEYAEIGIVIAFIGFYNETAPSKDQYETLQKFLKKSIKDRSLDENYLMYVGDELYGKNVAGKVFYEELKSWPHYTPALRIISQKEWGASKFSNYLFKFIKATTSIVFAHTGTDSCQTLSECAAVTIKLQRIDKVDRKLFDIRYNFLIGGNGIILVGRSWLYQSQIYDKFFDGLYIGLIGNYTDRSPQLDLIEYSQKLLQFAQSIGKLNSNCQLYVQSPLNLDQMEKNAGCNMINIISN